MRMGKEGHPQKSGRAPEADIVALVVAETARPHSSQPRVLPSEARSSGKSIVRSGRSQIHVRKPSP